MVHAGDSRAAGERRPVFGRRVPKLCRIHVAAGIVEAGRGGAAGDQHLAVGQQRGVEMAPAELHGVDSAPTRRRRVEVDDLGGILRRAVTSHHQDLAWRVHHRRPVVTRLRRPDSRRRSRRRSPTYRDSGSSPSVLHGKLGRSAPAASWRRGCCASCALVRLRHVPVATWNTWGSVLTPIVGSM